jgi:hypothetical protein
MLVVTSLHKTKHCPNVTQGHLPLQKHKGKPTQSTIGPKQ